VSAIGRRLQSIVAPVAAGSLGLTAGALLAEGAVLVPYWRSLEPAAFLEWYATHAELLFRFFAPLEITSTLLAIGSAALTREPLNGTRGLRLASALLAVAVLAAFPIYFAEVNSSFAAGTIPHETLADELTRWASWHWARTLLAIAAFAAALMGLRERPEQ
jgi:hypothetical protein